MENLEGIFLLILNMSITAAYVAIAIIAIRIIFLKKLPKIFSYSLWGILLFRLICPTSFSSAFSFLNLLKPKIKESTGIIEYIPQNIEMMQSPAVDVGIDRINKIVNASLPQATEIGSMNPMQLITFISTVIWIIGILALIIYSIITYVKVITNVKTATLFENHTVTEAMNKIEFRRKIKVFVTDQIESPFVCGLIIPKVYIPVNTSEKELPYILTHELVHVKRFDYLIKPFSYLILILHWFNPILWISFKLMSKDMEMSCDEKVMETLGDDIKQDYSNSLLSLAVKESRLLQGSPLAFGESNIKSRIKNVLKFKKPSFYLVTIIVMLIGMIGFILLTNPIGESGNTVKGLDYEKIYEHRTLYVGDASKVSGLANNLYYSEFKDGISLKTDVKPYGVTVNYSQTPEELSREGTISITDKMLKNVEMIFCLIDNVDKISFVFHDDGEVYTFPFERDLINEIFGEDTRNYSSSFNKFRNEFIPIIERENWNKVKFEVYITNKIELYVWRNKDVTGTDDVFYTLLPGTNKLKDEKEIYNLDIATRDMKTINEKLSIYQGDTHLSIRHDSSLSKQDMMTISDVIIFNGESRSIGVFGDGFNKEKLSDIGIRVEKLLQIIMSSPMTSSSPSNYDKAHQYEYETIIKMGDEALKYMLSLFEKGEDGGLKAHIMMSLCIDILGDRNNVEEGSYTSPREWYSKLSSFEAAKLPSFRYTSEDNIEKMVYSAALKQYSQRKDEYCVTIVAPKIFGTYEKEKELRIFTTVYYSHFKLYGKTLHNDDLGIIPAAIVYTKNNDGTYDFKEYIEAMDGSYFQKSIEEFCDPREEIAKEILNHYGNYEDLFRIMKDNITNYLKENNMKGVNLKQNSGIVPLT